MHASVVGSTHVDFYIRVPKLPRPGETVKGKGFVIKPGGKGANQAVGLGRLGIEVYMIGRIGKDYKDFLISNFTRNNVRTDYVFIDEEVNTGIAFILLSDDGENMIAFEPGTDNRLSQADLEKSEEIIRGSRVLLTQLEIPLETVSTALDIAKRHGVTTVLNPAPVQPLPFKVLEHADVLTPNAVEASMLTGIEVSGVDSALEAGRKLLEKGVGAAVITLGARGSVIVRSTDAYFIPAVRVEPVDTTGAGDAFNAGLAYGLMHGKDLVESVRLASIVAGLKVTKMGAQDGLPWLEELEKEKPRLYDQTKPVRIS
ncbi:MAG: ribokinase [Infirmifilum sp.]